MLFQIKADYLPEQKSRSQIDAGELMLHLPLSALPPSVRNRASFLFMFADHLGALESHGPSANHGSDMTSPAPHSNRQNPNKLGRRKAGKASNALLLSTPYLPSNFQVQWKVSWTSQEFSEVWKAERERRKKKKRERIWFRQKNAEAFFSTRLLCVKCLLKGPTRS